MTGSRGVQIGKWLVLASAAAVLFAVIGPRTGGTPGHVKPVSARQPMNDFSLRDLSGGRWTLSAHRGQVVLVNFWATWCAPCREETPGLIRLAKDYRSRGLSVAGITQDDNPAAVVPAFIRNYGVIYPVLLPDSTFVLGNEIDSLPTTFLIDRQGRVAKTYVGSVSESVFRADVGLLLGE